MSEFRTGDRVECISDYSEKIYIGYTGTIRKFSDTGNIGIEWDNFNDGHALDGLLPDSSGYFVLASNIKVISGKTKHARNKNITCGIPFQLNKEYKFRSMRFIFVKNKVTSYETYLRDLKPISLAMRALKENGYRNAMRSSNYTDIKQRYKKHIKASSYNMRYAPNHYLFKDEPIDDRQWQVSLYGNADSYNHSGFIKRLKTCNKLISDKRKANSQNNRYTNGHFGQKIGGVYTTPGNVVKFMELEIKRRQERMMEIYIEEMNTPKTPKNNNKHFGIELEVISTRSRSDLKRMLINYRSWIQIVDDGSINSEDEAPYNYDHEIKCCVENTYDGWSKLKSLLSDISECCKINKSCGTHVHYDIRQEADINKVAWNLLNAQPMFYSMQPESRQYNQYCEKRSDFDRSCSTSPTDYRADNKRCDNRYWGINLDAIRKHKTIEVRMHCGTIEFDKIKNWCDIIDYVSKANNVYTINWRTSVVRLHNIGMPQRLIDYVFERVSKFKSDKAAYDVAVGE